MINDYEKAQAAIERDAVKHDHATRRAMKEIAKWANGVNLRTDGEMGSDAVFFSIPVKLDDKLVKHAEIAIAIGINNEPYITSKLNDIQEEILSAS